MFEESIGDVIEFINHRNNINRNREKHNFSIANFPYHNQKITINNKYRISEAEIILNTYILANICEGDILK